jgi:hypothetical protein
VEIFFLVCEMKVQPADSERARKGVKRGGMSCGNDLSNRQSGVQVLPFIPLAPSVDFFFGLSLVKLLQRE